MKFLISQFIVPTWKKAILPYNKIALTLERFDELRRESHDMYKGVEKRASYARKNKEYDRAGHLFNDAAKMRKRHAIIYYKGIMDTGHQVFYNNTVKAAYNCLKKSRNIKKYNANLNKKKRKI